MDIDKLSESPKSIIYKSIPIIEKSYEKADPIILSEPISDMKFTKNIILVYQYPSDYKLFVPSYISADYQTHYAIYKLEENKLTLCFERLQIIFEGLVSYYIIRDIRNKLYELGLNKNDISNVLNNKYFFKG
jgi:hypothetical protein